MSAHTPGERVGAIFGADPARKAVEFFGYGVYVGDEVPPEEAGGFGGIVRAAGHTNPKILLDNGDVVWGCECWWGPEPAIRRRLAQYETDGWTIKTVRIADEREAARA